MTDPRPPISKERSTWEFDGLVRDGMRRAARLPAKGDFTLTFSRGKRQGSGDGAELPHCRVPQRRLLGGTRPRVIVSGRLSVMLIGAAAPAPR